MEIYDLEPVKPPEGLSPTQKAIWDQFEAAKISCLRKNFDYGDSVFTAPILADVPILTAIEVRMGDKIRRIQTLRRHEKVAVEESLRDTMLDLGVYAFLWLVGERFGSGSD